MPREIGLFNEFSLLQKKSTVLVIWSNLAMQIVIVAYPLSNQNKRIEPTPCAIGCAVVASTGLAFAALQCQTVKHVLAGLWLHRTAMYMLSAANTLLVATFFVHITKIFETAHLECKYPNLPTTGIPDMKNLQMAFRNRRSTTYDPAPYSEGYFGEHESQYGIQQASGATVSISSASAPAGPSRANISRSTRSGSRLISTPNIRYSPFPPRSNPPSASAGPSHMSASTSKAPAVARKSPLSTKEKALLKALVKGEGIQNSDYADLLENCGNCGCWFTKEVLRSHIPFC